MQKKIVYPKFNFNYLNSRRKCSQSVIKLFDSERADFLRQLYCYLYTKHTYNTPDSPQRIPNNILCNIVLSDRDIINATCLLNSKSCPGPAGIHP